MQRAGKRGIHRERTRAGIRQKIDRNAKQWGDDYIYTNWARAAKAKNMQDWKEGKIVKVYTEEYHKNGMDFSNTYYSDGTMTTACFGYDD